MYNTPEPFPQLVLDGDAPPPTLRPTVPRDRFARHLDRTAAPGVINPPGGRVRRVGEGAQYVAGRRDDDRQLDALHEQLGDYLDEPELEAKPAVTEPPGAVVKIDRLAAMLERKADSIRNWIEHGTIPPAPIRLAGNVRAWPAAEAAAIVAAARRERILSKPRRPIGESNFSILCWDARTQQQMRDERN